MYFNVKELKQQNSVVQETDEYKKTPVLNA